MDKKFKDWASPLYKKYKESRKNAWLSVNGEMLYFYYELGHEIHESTFRNEPDFFRKLSVELTTDKEGVLIFSEKNLRNIELFYIFNGEIIKELASDLSDDDFLNKAIALSETIIETMCKISWSHLLIIIETCLYNPKKAWFYINKAVENDWSKKSLADAISSELYEKAHNFRSQNNDERSA